MRKRTNPERGFSLIEALVAVSIAFAMLAIAVPSFLQTYRSYQLDNTAGQVAGVLKSTRADAIRLNTQVNCIIQVAGGQTNMWSASDGTLIEKSTEKQILLSGNVNLVAAGVVPNTGGLTGAIGVPVLTATPLNGVADTFDGRGAANPAAPPGVFVLYVGNTAIPAVGYRAVILMPSGSIQVWSADSAGSWHQTS